MRYARWRRRFPASPRRTLAGAPRIPTAPCLRAPVFGDGAPPPLKGLTCLAPADQAVALGGRRRDPGQLLTPRPHFGSGDGAPAQSARRAARVLPCQDLTRSRGLPCRLAAFRLGGRGFSRATRPSRAGGPRSA